MIKLFTTYTPIISEFIFQNHTRVLSPNTLLKKETSILPNCLLFKIETRADSTKRFLPLFRAIRRKDGAMNDSERVGGRRKRGRRKKQQRNWLHVEKISGGRKGKEKGVGVKANSRCLRWELGSGGSPSPGLWNEKAIQFCPCSDAVDIRHPSASRHQKQRRLLGFALPHITTNHPQNNRLYIYVHPLQLIDTGGNNKVINKNP